jgi:hypothetical protein
VSSASRRQFISPPVPSARLDNTVTGPRNLARKMYFAGDDWEACIVYALGRLDDFLVGILKSTGLRWLSARPVHGRRT